MDYHYFNAPPQNCLHSYAFAQALVFIAPSSESVQLTNSIYFNFFVGLEFQQLSKWIGSQGVPNMLEQEQNNLGQKKEKRKNRERNGTPQF